MYANLSNAVAAKEKAARQNNKDSYLNCICN